MQCSSIEERICLDCPVCRKDYPSGFKHAPIMQLNEVQLNEANLKPELEIW
jgi:hypothetical protein